MLDNLLNKIGRAGLMAIVSALAFFSAELGALEGELSGIAAILVALAIGGLSRLIESLRDQWDLQRLTTAFRSQVTLMEVGRLGRLVRGAAMGIGAFGLTFVFEWMGILPDLSTGLEILIFALTCSTNVVLEVLRDRYELATLKSRRKA